MKLIQDSKPKIFPTKNKATHHPVQPTDHLFDQAPCYSLIRYSLLALLPAWAELNSSTPADSLRAKPLFPCHRILSGECWPEAESDPYSTDRSCQHFLGSFQLAGAATDPSHCCWWISQLRWFAQVIHSGPWLAEQFLGSIPCLENKTKNISGLSAKTFSLLRVAKQIIQSGWAQRVLVKWSQFQSTWHQRTRQRWESDRLVDSIVALTVHVMGVTISLLSLAGSICSTASVSGRHNGKPLPWQSVLCWCTEYPNG